MVQVAPNAEAPNWSVDNYRAMQATCTQLKLELMTEEAHLADLQTALEESNRESAVLGTKNRSAAQIEAQAQGRPRSDEASKQWNEIYDRAEKIKQDSRDSGDPAERNARKKLQQVNRTMTASTSSGGSSIRNRCW